VQEYPFQTYLENGLKLDFHFAIDMTAASGESQNVTYLTIMEKIETHFQTVAASLSGFGGKAGPNTSNLDFINGGDCSFGAINAFNEMKKGFVPGGPANYEIIIKRVRPHIVDDFNYRVLCILTASPPNDL
jgi:hypothetical protein